MQSAYGWTISEIDDNDVDVLLDQLLVVALKDDDQPQQKYIEDVM